MLGFHVFRQSRFFLSTNRTDKPVLALKQIVADEKKPEDERQDPLVDDDQRDKWRFCSQPMEVDEQHLVQSEQELRAKQYEQTDYQALDFFIPIDGSGSQNKGGIGNQVKGVKGVRVKVKMRRDRYLKPDHSQYCLHNV